MNSIKRVNGMKVIKKWNLGLFISLILMILAVGGTIALLYLLPITVFSYPNQDSTYEVYASDFIFFAAQDWLGTDNINDAFFRFKNYGLDVLIPSDLNSIVFVIIYAIAGLLAVVGVFAVICVIIFLCGLLFGVIKGNWKAMKVMTWLVFAFMFIVALIFAALKLCFMYMLTEYGVVYYDMDIWNLVYIVAGLLVFGIIQSIVYSICFKDRIYIKDAKRILEAQKQRQEMMQQQMYPQGFAMPMPMVMNAPNYQMAPTQNQVTPTQTQPIKTNPTVVTQVKYSAGKGLPEQISSIGGHAFSQNANLEVAIIPLGIKEIGPSAFSNCPNLKVVSIPTSVIKIGYNAFFGCKKLARINYGGRKNEWKNITRGSNWLASSGTSVVVCVDGAITVNPYH